MSPRLRLPARLLVPFSRRHLVRPLVRLPGSPQGRHTRPCQPWPVDRWIVAGLWAACVLGFAWRSGALAWVGMWASTWAVAGTFYLAGMVTG